MKFADIKVELLEVMGSDLTVVNAARVSMDKMHEEFEPGDERLINYLVKHDHWSPLAHPHVSFRIKAPIFVARQLVKHQVGLTWNEVSRRYVDSDPEFYLPECRARAENVKQGSQYYEIQNADIAYTAIEVATNHSFQAYRTLLSMNVAPEVARAVLPLNSMTEWVWTGSLMAFIRVMKLRLDGHAQKECRIVAQQIKEFLKLKFPYTMKAVDLDN